MRHGCLRCPNCHTPNKDVSPCFICTSARESIGHSHVSDVSRLSHLQYSDTYSEVRTAAGGHNQPLQPGRHHQPLQPGRCHQPLIPGRRHQPLQQRRRHQTLQPGRRHQTLQPGRRHQP